MKSLMNSKPKDKVKETTDETQGKLHNNRWR